VREQRGRHVRRRADAACADAKLPGLREAQQARQVLHAKPGAAEQHEQRGADQRHGRGIRDRVVGELAVERGVGAMRRALRPEQRAAIRLGARHGLRADIAAGAGAVVDKDGLPEHRRPGFRDEPRDDVVRPAGGERHDEADRAPAEDLRAERPRRGRREGAAEEEAPGKRVRAHGHASTGRAGWRKAAVGRAAAVREQPERAHAARAKGRRHGDAPAGSWRVRRVPWRRGRARTGWR
jgi:hypothetical protein